MARPRQVGRQRQEVEPLGRRARGLGERGERALEVAARVGGEVRLRRDHALHLLLVARPGDLGVIDRAGQRRQVGAMLGLGRRQRKLGLLLGERGAAVLDRRTAVVLRGLRRGVGRLGERELGSRYRQRAGLRGGKRRGVPRQGVVGVEHGGLELCLLELVGARSVDRTLEPADDRHRGKARADLRPRRRDRRAHALPRTGLCRRLFAHAGELRGRLVDLRERRLAVHVDDDRHALNHRPFGIHVRPRDAVDDAPDKGPLSAGAERRCSPGGDRARTRRGSARRSLRCIARSRGSRLAPGARGLPCRPCSAPECPA